MQWESREITDTKLPVWNAGKKDIEELRRHFRTIYEERKSAPEAIRKFPQYVEHIEAEAEDAVKDMVRLPGNPEKSFIGNPPSWHEKRYNDKEYLWQMNRMTHWTWMCFGYALTGDEKYARKVTEELLSWCEAVPVDMNILEKGSDYFSECHPMRILEVGIRLHRSWPHIINFLYPSPYFTDEVIRQLADSVHYQASLLRVVSPALWPRADHNHFIMEMLGLLTAALYFPVFPEAEEWKTYAIEQLERAIRAQLTEDGGQIEGCPSYHDGCMFWFGLPLVFEKRFGIRLSDEYRRRYLKSLDYSLFVMRPTGTCVPVGDSHASDRGVISGMYAYECFGRKELLEALRLYMKQETIENVMEEYVWYLSDTTKVLDLIQHLEPSEPDLPATFFNETLGQGVMKTDWSLDGHSVLMTCRSPIFDNHAHIDLNSFDYTALGKIIISDPSYFCYRQDEDRKTFKTTGYHSTIKVDDRDQFEYIGSFQFGPQRNGRMLRAERRSGYSISTGWHDSYAPLEHLRHLVLSDDGFLVVVDVLTGGSGEKIHSNFHYDYTDVKLYGTSAYGFDDKANVHMKVYPEEKLEYTPGRISDRNDTARPSSMISFDSSMDSSSKVWITVIAPFREKNPEIEISELEGRYIIRMNDDSYAIELRDKDLDFDAI